jgi:WD40 repeat protein/class 3 adenylate cyclase
MRSTVTRARCSGRQIELGALRAEAFAVLHHTFNNALHMSVEAQSELLTFLIADVRGYTSFTQSHGDEAAARLAGAFAEIAREGVEAHGGKVIELRGDEALAVFASAPAALRAAVDLQLIFADEVELHPELPLRVGIGVDAGPAVPVEGGYRGGALNLAARLCSKAGPGEVFASEGVLRLAGTIGGLTVHPHGQFEMKGLSDLVHVSRVSLDHLDPDALAARFEPDGRVAPEPSDVPRALDRTTPIVGRDPEIHRLRWAWRLARRHEGSALLILGPPGIGKTRLIAELAASVAHDGASVSYLTRSERLAPGIVDGELDGETPALVVLDDLEEGGSALELATSLWRSAAGTRALLVVAMDDSALTTDLRALVREAGDAVVRPAPLDLDDIREIAGLYFGGSAETLPASLLESTGGIPRRIHRQVSEWAFAEAGRRLGASASKAAAERSGLRSVESELAGNVVHLQSIRERARLYGSSDDAVGEPASSPFKGLASFDVRDEDLFFGRERLVGELVARLAGARLLAVVGPSGSGKSSAVRAGLIPSVRSGVLPGSEGWRVALFRPGEHPIGELGRSLRSAITPTTALEAEAPVGELLAGILDGEHVLLVVDQFEEVFTACADESERAAFLAALADAANRPRGGVTVVLAIRADHYGRCAENPALAQLLGSNHVLIGSMTGDEYRRAIEQPALRVGVHVEPALTEALVAEVGDEPGALPLLSTALLELWERREGRAITLDAYLTTGGVRGAVSRLAEEVFGGFSLEQQAIARAVMLRLAAPGENETVVRRRVPLVEFDPEQNPDVAHVVEVLIDRRLLTVSDGVVEVAHEALLREWPRLRGWLDEDRAGRVLHAHLIDATRGWARGGQDPGELYRGARLASALDWTTEHTLELNELEREFLSASREASQQEVERQRRANRRLRGLLVGVAAFLVVALVAGGLAIVQRSRARRSAEVADAQRLGAQAVVEDELDTSLLLAREAIAIDDSVHTRSTLLASLLKAPGAISVLPGTGDRVLEIDASAEGRIFATTDNVGGVAIYDADALRLLRIVRPDQEAGSIAVSADGTTVVQALSGDEGTSLGFISVSDGSVRDVALPRGVELAGIDPIVYRPDGSEILSIESRPDSNAPSIVRRDAVTGHRLAAQPLAVANPDTLKISNDGSTLAIGSFGPDRVTALDAETFQPIASFAQRGPAFGIAPDGQTIAIGNWDGSVEVVDVPTGEHRILQGRHTASVQGVGFSPDGSTLVTTGDDRDVIVWDLEAGAIREILHGHAGRAFGPAFDRSGDTAFTVGLDDRVIAWDLTSERRIGRRSDYADSSAFNGDGDFVTAGTADGSLFAFSGGNGRVVVQVPGTSEPVWETDPWTDGQFQEIQDGDVAFAPFDTDLVTSLAFDPGGDVLAVSGQHRQVVTYEAGTGRELARWNGSEIAWVNSLTFAPDGSLVTANDDGRVAYWDPTTGELRRELRATPFQPDPAAFSGAVANAVPSPDGSAVAVITYELGGSQELETIDARSGDVIWDGAEPDRWGSVVAWSPDARFLATGGRQSGELNLWDAATGRRVAEPAKASAGFVLSIDFAWQGSLIVAGGTDGTVRLFDSDSLEQVGANIPADDNQGASTDVLPGDEMLVLSNTGHEWRWDLDPVRWARQACTVANRNLTRAEWRAFLPGWTYAPSCRT